MAHAHAEQEMSAHNAAAPQDASGWLGRAFRHRWLRRAAMAVLALLVLLAGVHTALTVYFGMRLRATLAELRARGETLDIRRACAGPPVPPHENAAPLYLAARALIKDPRPYHYPPGTEKWDLAAARQALQGDSDALRLIFTASRRSGCQFDVQWDDGIDARLDHLTQMRSLARFMAAAIVVAAEEGWHEEAWRRVEAAFAMSSHMAMEATVISQLVSYAMDGIWLEAVKVALTKASACRQMQQALLTGPAHRDFTAELVRGFRGDRSVDVDTFHRLRRQPDFPVRATWPDACRPRVLVSSYLGRPFQYADELAYLQLMDFLVGSAAGPFRAQDERQVENAVIALPRYCVLTRAFVPAYSRITWERAKAVANRSLLQTAVALEVYRAEKGRYPETLALLRKEFPNVAAEDVFSGKELVYRLEGDGFLLYSLGPDCRDDGGRPLDQREYPPRGDLVWIPHGQEAAFKARAAQADAKKSEVGVIEAVRPRKGR